MSSNILHTGEALKIHADWFSKRGWTCFPFQQSCAEKYLEGYQGLLNAPTGSGKTYALAIPVISEYLALKKKSSEKGVYLLWITPLKALSKDICTAIQVAADEMESGWRVVLRNGDTPVAERAEQKRNEPHCMVITPESLHLLLASKGYASFFRNLQAVVVDEWHELLGSKRGVQVELALSRLRAIRPGLKVWGISATIGNLEEAREILIPAAFKVCTVQSEIRKKPQIQTLIPDNPENLPWSGHLGIAMLEKVLQVINANQTTLVFTNTRSQSEIWYQRLLDEEPSLAGRIAIHHGSLNNEVRQWVEQNLHSGALKAVVCTSSLDLGVDFRPVDAVVQIGSPKGVARFVQRAGRSGHRPGEKSRIWFAPTHALELLEAAALKTAVENEIVESRIPVVRAFDVLIQYLITLAVSDGFREKELYNEIAETHAFRDISRQEWEWMLQFITQGGESLNQYGDFHKVHVDAEGIFRVISRKIAMQHRLSIGTISSDTSIFVKMMGGANLGSIEEYFISRLNPGDAFVFAGKMLELIKLEGNTAFVRRSKAKKGQVPSWQGGRMSLSSELSYLLRLKVQNYRSDEPELKALSYLFDIQESMSSVPGAEELLIETLKSDDGYHLFVFPFEGRMVNEGMATLLAYRFSRIRPASFSIAVNDYGFELLCAEPIPLEEGLEEDIFSTAGLISDLYASTNYTEMAGRRFSDIARISGLVFKGTADKPVRNKHLQASARLFFEVFREYEPENLLLRQAEEEALYYQLEEHRLRAALYKVNSRNFVIRHTQRPSPLAFPILVDRLSREQLSNEPLEMRIERMLKNALK